jgi:hypothetical protein
VTRKAGKEYSAWKGDVNTGKATLYSKYVTDGIPGTSPFFLELSNDQAVLPLENGTIDPGFKGEISTELYLYEGNNPIANNIAYSIDPSDVGTFDSKQDNKVIFDHSKLNDISEVICTAKYPVINGNYSNAKPYSRKFRITKTNNAYEIVPSTHVLVRDEYGNISSTTNLSVEVKK